MADGAGGTEMRPEKVPNGHCDGNDSSEQTSDEEKPEREITQTDHLNKRLLGAFLDRLNRNEVAMVSGMNFAVSQVEGNIQEINLETGNNESEWDSPTEHDVTEDISDDADAQNS